MNCANKALLVVMVLATLGLWGCAQRPSGTGNARIRDLESRIAKLEEDYQAAVVARDQFHKKLVTVEDQRAQLAEQVDQLQAVAKERDELKKQVTVRAGERDALHSQLIQLGKELQNLAGRIESATANIAPATITSAAAVGPGGKS
jgi:chromosome segregation ATPase